MKTGAHFLPGETQILNTSCIIKGKGKFKLSIFLLPYENLPLCFESGGYIDRNFKGRILIKLTNYSTKKVKVNSGTCIGYIVMQPYSLE